MRKKGLNETALVKKVVALAIMFSVQEVKLILILHAHVLLEFVVGYKDL